MTIAIKGSYREAIDVKAFLRSFGVVADINCIYEIEVADNVAERVKDLAPHYADYVREADSKAAQGGR